MLKSGVSKSENKGNGAGGREDFLDRIGGIDRMKRRIEMRSQAALGFGFKLLRSGLV